MYPTRNTSTTLASSLSSYARSSARVPASSAAHYEQPLRALVPSTDQGSGGDGICRTLPNRVPLQCVKRNMISETTRSPWCTPKSQDFAARRLLLSYCAITGQGGLIHPKTSDPSPFLALVRLGRLRSETCISLIYKTVRTSCVSETIHCKIPSCGGPDGE
ncbi:hypothetical protein BC826DRAFT_603980 [Russula brevipes]|nr:hypothetical protein BC826DRAFT_603980 [Russula brevipes]